MKRLFVFVVIAVLSIGAFYSFKKEPSPAASIKLASVQPSQGLLAATNEQVLAINAEGHIYGFGQNRQHELGLVGVENVPIPKLVSEQRNWRFVHLGSNVSLALDQYGKLWRRLYLRNERMSADELAALGERTHYFRIDPELLFRKAMEKGGMAVALDDAQSLWFWHESSESFASQYSGRLSESPPERREIQPQQKWRDFSLCGTALLAIGEDGALWRLNVKDMPDTRYYYSSRPSSITLNRVDSIMPSAERVFCSAYGDTVMLLDSKGGLWGYGSNTYGELGTGDGSVDQRNSHPVNAISRLAPGYYSELVTSSGFTLAIHRDGSLWAWGLNTSGQLGLGKEISGTDKPRLVDNAHTWIAIAAGHDFAVGMTSEGELFSWGTNHQGTLGEGGSTPRRNNPLPVFGEQKWGGVVQ